MIHEILKIIDENREFLKKMGWIVSDPYSFEWWGGLKSADEIAISAFLVQMTKWETVAKVIENLRRKGLNYIDKIAELPLSVLEDQIRSVNFYKTKARRLKNFSEIVSENGGLKNFLTVENRDKILEIEGIGEETADSLLLFANNQLVFPQSEYLRRVLSRVLNKKMSKKEAKNYVEENLKKDLFLYKLFHAGVVSIGKAFCYLNKPKCDKCILKPLCRSKYNETL
ncbi:endonuclease III domain-containing protein [Acidianus infernus]|uniref:Endonuclease III domain-containing protein n=1 Tax=Acidianus infernus TaxID=12915 RepID=A0A6A9QA77_ACIIN|nr:endonuclease III domain-containing protein [Acidianus infernus]MCY0873338.1 endonuclease III domain-containing protein [Acidianus infernus]MCY0882843.1 endonuclease III domain-containing protein [Acidianus infernus]MUM63809.1 endonuclease III domain-containing protein [Acidianus infernus]